VLPRRLIHGEARETHDPERSSDASRRCSGSPRRSTQRSHRHASYGSAADTGRREWSSWPFRPWRGDCRSHYL